MLRRRFDCQWGCLDGGWRSDCELSALGERPNLWVSQTIASAEGYWKHSSVCCQKDAFPGAAVLRASCLSSQKEPVSTLWASSASILPISVMKWSDQPPQTCRTRNCSPVLVSPQLDLRLSRMDVTFATQYCSVSLSGRNSYRFPSCWRIVEGHASSRTLR